MEITTVLHAATREQWRQWLAEHHAAAREIWLVTFDRRPGESAVPYLQAVEEALCFGWIDGITKKLDAERTVVRFTPRRRASHWTELNKARARRLIAEGRMTGAGRAVLPDLTLTPLAIAPDILAALQAAPPAWQNFERFPDLYRRIRVEAVEEVRADPALFQQRLENLVKKTRANKMYGVWE